MGNKSQQNMFLAPTDPNEVVTLIQSIKNSSGHDGITAALIKEIKNEISYPLTILINKFLPTRIFTKSLKIAKVIPIYNSKDRELFDNYKPISLLPTIFKILEKITHKRLYNFSLFLPKPIWIRQKHSTTQLSNT